MIRGGFGQSAAEERAARYEVTATFGDATHAANVLKEADREHLQVDDRGGPARLTAGVFGARNPVD